MEATYQKCSKCGLKAMSGPLASVEWTCHSCGSARVEITYEEFVEEKPILYSSAVRGGSSCHYCGQTATGFGFFDEPVCPQCGG
jgi:hypothetical protein